MTLRVASTLAVVAIAVVLVIFGRHERSADLRARNAEIAQIARLADGNFGQRLTAYRTTPWFGCFLYGMKARVPFGVELCFDQSGRLIEAIDRRSTTTHIGTLRFDPGAATTRVDPALLLRVLQQRARRRYPASLTALPLGADGGPILLPKRRL